MESFKENSYVPESYFSSIADIGRVNLVKQDFTRFVSLGMSRVFSGQLFNETLLKNCITFILSDRFAMIIWNC